MKSTTRTFTTKQTKKQKKIKTKQFAKAFAVSDEEKKKL